MALLTINEAADALNVHERTIRNWITEGRVRSFRVNPNGQIYIKDTDLFRLADKINQWRQKIADEKDKELQDED